MRELEIGKTKINALQNTEEDNIECAKHLEEIANNSEVIDIVFENDKLI